MKASRSRWRKLATEKAHPGSRRLDRLGIPGTIALMQREDRRVLAALAAARPALAAAGRAFRECFLSGGTCWLYGAGTSGRLAVLEAAELPPTFGIGPGRVRAVMAGGPGAVFRSREGAEDRRTEGSRMASAARAGDLLIGVSASSLTPFVRGALARARARKARTILVTASPSPGLSRHADIVVALDVGPEILAGSTRLKAGTATKLALNQITTSAFAASGKVYGPWMVDLSAGSAKLKDRALRIVAAAGGLTVGRASTLLRTAKGEVKVAILMALRNLSAAQARERLATASGDLRSSLERGQARPRKTATAKRRSPGTRSSSIVARR
jgi:N-acetylmuramic acid 6-phosphate etherase